MASSAWIFGVDMYAIHLYAQFGSGALAASIHVSAQPVAPSFGMVSLTGAVRGLQRRRLIRPRRTDDDLTVLEE